MGGSLGTQLGGSFRWSPTGEASKEIQSSGKQNAKASVAGPIISLQGGVSREDGVGKNPDGVCVTTNDFFPPLGARVGGGEMGWFCLLSLAFSAPAAQSAKGEMPTWITD